MSLYEYKKDKVFVLMFKLDEAWIFYMQNNRYGVIEYSEEFLKEAGYETCIL